MNNRALLLMSLLMAQGSGAPEVSILDEVAKEPPKENILLVHDTTHDYHFGSLASFLALKKGIEKRGYTVNTFSTKKIHSIKGSPLDLAGFKDAAIFWTFCSENPDFIEAVRASDTVIINGGGAIHGASAYALKLLYLAYISKVFLRKSVQIINHSVYC